MIGYFPDPYPDELLYSTCARYRGMTLYKNKEIVNEELFGVRFAQAMIHLPQRLEHLVTSLPPGNCYTVDQLIDRHTSYPFFSLFLPPERASKTREAMKVTNSRTLSSTSGASSHFIPFPLWLRFCPLCAEDDRERFGEYYWHRLHQLPGVEVCPAHEVWLENSNERARDRISGMEYVSANRAIINVATPRLIETANSDHRALVQIARDSSWMLDQKDLVPGTQAILACYLDLLANQGLATQSGFVHRDKIKEFMLGKYSPELLKLLHCEIKAVGKKDWLIALRTTLLNKAAHPLRHLLLIQALGCTVEEFLTRCANISNRNSDQNFKPFGDAPWPCLNRASDHFGELLVKDFQMAHTREPNRRLLGIFSCACGFIYSRTGPDSLPEDRFRIYRIKAYGPVWETKLRTLWNDPTLGLREICQQLGLGQRATLRRQAARLGLKFPRPGPGPDAAQASPEFLSKYCTDDEAAEKRLSYYRTKWLSGMKSNPAANTTKEIIRNKEFAPIYRWLLKNDTEWLNNHRPLPDEKFAGLLAAAKRHQDRYEKRDKEFAPAIERAIKRLRSRDGCPIKLTLKAICKEANILTINRGQLKNLPRTAKVFGDAAETQIDLSIRRIRWATDRFKEENIIPSRTKLMIRAIIALNYQKVDEIKEAANQALRELANFTQGV